MADLNGALTPEQHKAIEALLGAPTIKAAADLTGVDEVTLYIWLAEPAFAAAYRRARRAALGQSLARLQRAASTAVTVLIEALDHVDKETGVRVAAARAILDLSIKSAELEDLEARVAALEHEAVYG